MERTRLDVPADPYHFVLQCIGGKWKMTILSRIHSSGRIRFNQILRVLPISEKVLSQQLKELVRDGLVQRIVDGDTYPPSIEYSLTAEGQQLIPVLDDLYVWAVRQMDDRDIPIDTGSFETHRSKTVVKALRDIMEADTQHPDAGE